MTLTPAQLRSLMGSEGLDCSQGWLADQLGWQGENATLRIRRLQNEDEEIPLTTAKHIIRIAREHNLALIEGKWQPITDK